MSSRQFPPGTDFTRSCSGSHLPARCGIFKRPGSGEAPHLTPLGILLSCVGVSPATCPTWVTPVALGSSRVDWKEGRESWNNEVSHTNQFLPVSCCMVYPVTLLWGFVVVVVCFVAPGSFGGTSQSRTEAPNSNGTWRLTCRLYCTS